MQHALIHDPPKPVCCRSAGAFAGVMILNKREMEATRMDLDVSLLTLFQLRTWAPT